MGGIDQVTIFADESYNADHYIVSFALATGPQIRAVEAAWVSLQEEIREVLMAEYPLARRSLKENELPEIKSNSLFKSSGYFSKNDSGKPRYWEQQWEWLERAYAIGAACGIDHFSLALPAHTNPAPLNGVALLSETYDIKGFPIPQSVKDAMNRIETDRHVAMVAMSLCAIGAFLEREKTMANIIWDEHSLGSVISQLKSPAYLRERGVFGWILDHSFGDSRTMPMLQLADVHAYISRANHQARFGTPPKNYEVLSGIPPRYPGRDLLPAPVSAWQMSLSRLPAVEMVYRGSGGPREYQRVRDLLLPTLFDSVFEACQRQAFEEERAFAHEQRKQRSWASRAKKMFSGKGARTQTADSLELTRNDNETQGNDS